MEHDAEIFADVFEHARDIILVIDVATGGLLDANRAAELAYQYDRAEILKLSIYDLRISEAPSVKEQMDVANAQGILFETMHRRRDGSTFPVEVSSRGGAMRGRTCLFSIIRDVTERKRLEADRERTLADIQRALVLRDEFVMIASHELLTPVTNISLQLQQLVRQLDRGAGGQGIATLGAAAIREAHRLSGLIDTLLIAAIAKGELALHVSDVDLGEVLVDVADRLRMRALEAGSELVIGVDQPIRGRWDRLRVDQVLTNLLVNAVKYGRGKAVRASARLEGARAVLEVVDEGVGIQTKDADRIFDKFERALPVHHGGFGLGLFIARQIVEAHRGSIEVESVVGVGTTFRVFLPTA